MIANRPPWLSHVEKARRQSAQAPGGTSTRGPTPNDDPGRGAATVQRRVVLMRPVATAGVVSLGVLIGAILVSADVARGSTIRRNRGAAPCSKRPVGGSQPVFVDLRALPVRALD
jgi:hypothetical protein